MKVNDILKEWRYDEYDVDPRYEDDGPEEFDPDNFTALSDGNKNNHWFENLFMTPHTKTSKNGYQYGGDWWFTDTEMQGYPVEGGHPEFDKLFSGDGDATYWEDFYYNDYDQEDIVNGGPDPKEYGIDPTRTGNTNFKGYKKFIDDWVVWFKGLLQAGTVFHKDDHDNDFYSGDGPDVYEPDEQDYADASSDWQNSRGL